MSSGLSGTHVHRPPDETAFSGIWEILYAHKIMIASVSLLVAAMAVFASYLMRPIFRADVLVSPVAEQRNPLGGLATQFGGLAALGGVSLGGSGSRATAIATLNSRSLTEAFIQDRNLLPVLFENDWDSASQRWKENDPKKIPGLWDAYRVFDKKIRKIEEDRRTGLVTLSIEWHDPKVAADWANELVRRANAKLQQDTIAEGDKTIAYLEQQLAKAGVVEVRQALYGLIEVETKNIAVAHAREEFAFKVIDPAVVPRKKVKPSRVLFLVVGLLAGFAMSSGWVVFRSAAAQS